MGKMICLPTAVLFVSLFGSGLSSSQSPLPQPGKYIVYGQGIKSCTAWTADRSNALLHGSELAWITGYLTGIGPFVEFHQTDADGIDRWMDTFCAKHQDMTIEDATTAMISSLR